MTKQHDLDFVDKLGMYKIYDKWPEIAQSAFNSDLEEISFDEIDHIVFAGMGGSGTIGDVFASIMSKTDIHVSVVKGYQLPNTTNENTLVVCTSVSGNTVETISILEQVKKNNLKSISFS